MAVLEIKLTVCFVRIVLAGLNLAGTLYRYEMTWVVPIEVLYEVGFGSKAIHKCVTADKSLKYLCVRNIVTSDGSPIILSAQNIILLAKTLLNQLTTI